MVSSSGCAHVAGAPSSRGVVGRDASVSAPERSKRIDAVRLRFPRSCRLTARKQYLVVYGRGRRVGSQSLTLFGLPNSLETCRLGITVTRKVGSAARRNRIKRMLREVFRRRRRELMPEMDLVVNVHPSARRQAQPGMHELSLAEVEQEFMTTFSKLVQNARTPRRGSR